jgi:bacteriorhodopsin
MTLLLWTAYPIVFGLTEGANKIGVDAEIIAYGVLDVAAKLGFTFMLLFIHTHGDENG